MQCSPAFPIAKKAPSKVHRAMLLNSMKQSHTNSLAFHNYKTRKYLLKHHKLGPVQTLVTVEIYRQELGQD